MTRIERPIFIIWIQRSGTTIIDSLFSRHRDTAFFEGFCNRYYMTPWKFHLIPLQIKRCKSRPPSTEEPAWRRYFTEIDYVHESHATDEIKNYYHSAVRQTSGLSAQKGLSTRTLPTAFTSGGSTQCSRTRTTS